MTPDVAITAVQIAGAIALLVGCAVVWTRTTTRPAADPHAEPHGDVPHILGD